MRPTSDPIRRATLVLLAVCALLPTLIALIAIGLGAAAPTTQGLTQATGALSAAAFQGLDRRALDMAPLTMCPTLAFEGLRVVRQGLEAPAAAGHPAPSPLARLPLRV